MPDLVVVLDEILNRPALDQLVIDLSEVAFLGSAGLGVLVDLATRTATGPQPAAEPTRSTPALRVVAPADRYAVVRPWTTMNLHHILPLYPTVSFPPNHGHLRCGVSDLRLTRSGGSRT